MTPGSNALADPPRYGRFRDLYRGEFAFVWSAACHFGVPSGAVDDVVQDVFLTAYRRLDQLQFEVSPRAWLFGVTRRVAFRYRRGAARLARRHAAFAELSPREPAVPQQRHDDAQLLARALDELGEGTRAVWEMTEMLGMSAPEIASELALPLNTVYSRLRLARRQMQQVVGEARLAGCCDAARTQQAPPREAEARTWGLIVPVLGKSAGDGLAAWASSQAAAATTMIVAGAAAVGLVVARGPARAAEPGRAPIEAVAPVARAVAADSEKSLETGPSEHVQESMPERSRAAEAPPRPAADARLAEEIAAIDRIQARLAGGDAAAALAGVDEHARRFPAGTLADVREAARVDALCRLQAIAAADAAARALVAAHPASAVAQRYAQFDADNSCDK